MALGEEIVDLSEALLKATHAPLLAHVGEEVAKHTFLVKAVKVAIATIVAEASKVKSVLNAEKLDDAKEVK